LWFEHIEALAKIEGMRWLLGGARKEFMCFISWLQCTFMKARYRYMRREEEFKIINSPGSFFVRNDAFVIIDFDTVTTVVDGVKATEMPIGPSLGCPVAEKLREI
jgi:hypothetical protein